MSSFTTDRESFDEFLAVSEVIDWTADRIVATAERIRGTLSNDVAIAQAAFDWVRDKIKHTADFNLTDVTCSASEVLRLGTGICYAKSHLLAALLRANKIPAGFCYQRLSINDQGPPYCLHGFNAVYLSDYGWYRMDARGNKAGVETSFTPPHERLAFAAALPGELTFSEIWPEPLDIVVESLRRYRTCNELCSNLPDRVP